MFVKNVSLIVVSMLALSACQKAKMRKMDPKRAATQERTTTDLTPNDNIYAPPAPPPPTQIPEEVKIPLVNTPVPPRPIQTQGEGQITPVTPAADIEDIKIVPAQPNAVIDQCLGQSCQPEGQALPEQETRFEQAVEPHTDKLDILIVVDSSQSLDAEREKVGKELGKFVDELGRYGNKVDYNVAVMLGHGPDSLIALEGSKGDTIVNAHGTLFRNSVDEKQVFTAKNGIESIKAKLQKRLASVKNYRERDDVKGEQGSLAQGEAGMLSLYSAIRDGEKLAAIQSQGFFRPDAALAVVFIADENDVCFDYSSDYAKKNNIKPRWRNKQPGVQDPKEVTAFKAICGVGKGGKTLTPGMVLKALQDLKGEMPLILSGIMYTDNNNIPKSGQRESKGASFEENEAGRGYLELISLGRGEPQDLAGGIIGKKLAAIGDLSAFRMQYENSFRLVGADGKDVADPSQIDPSSVQVEVYDQSNSKPVKTFNTTDSNAQLELEQQKDGEVSRAYVTVKRDLLRDVVKPGQRVVVKYKYRRGGGR